MPDSTCAEVLMVEVQLDHIGYKLLQRAVAVQSKDIFCLILEYGARRVVTPWILNAS